jgi:uncharacterized surface protein with fasciclin (FAS1) repeats
LYFENSSRSKYFVELSALKKAFRLNSLSPAVNFLLIIKIIGEYPNLPESILVNDSSQDISAKKITIHFINHKTLHMNSVRKFALFLTAGLFSLNVMAQTSKDIVDVAVGSADHTTLVAAVKAADLVATLKSKGPFTVFAPTNAAFDKLPAGTVAGLLKPESKAALTGILTYHVVAGNLTAKDVLAAIKAGNGKAVVTTVQGQSLTATIENGKVTLTDAKGGKSTVVATDLTASNGVIHVIDAVLLPAAK